MLIVRIDTKMPKNCDNCMFDYDGICCTAVLVREDGDFTRCRHHDISVYKGGREEWCPLVEEVTNGDEGDAGQSDAGESERRDDGESEAN